MAELSRNEVVAILGSRIGDALVAEIIATGVTKEELKVAYDQVVKDLKTHDHGPPLEPGHIAQVVGILERLRSQGIFGAAGSRLE
jgi:hypothetical protein